MNRFLAVRISLAAFAASAGLRTHLEASGTGIYSQIFILTDRPVSRTDIPTSLNTGDQDALSTHRGCGAAIPELAWRGPEVCHISFKEMPAANGNSSSVAEYGSINHTRDIFKKKMTGLVKSSGHLRRSHNHPRSPA